MEQLILNDGTVIEGHAIRDGRSLYVYINQMTLAEGFAQLSDSTKTQRIVSKYFGDEEIFEGFTHLSNLSEQEGGMLSAILKKPEVNG